MRIISQFKKRVGGVERIDTSVLGSPRLAGEAGCGQESPLRSVTGRVHFVQWSRLSVPNPACSTEREGEVLG